MRVLKDERGISLMEVIASIVMITIILFSFLALFLQTKKTNVQSEAIQNATYLAQIEMEEIYLTSQNSPIDNPIAIIAQLEAKSFKHITTKTLTGCTATLAAPKEYKNEIKLKKESPPFNVIVTISKLCDYEKAGHVLIEVFDSSNTKKAFIENIYIWN